MKNNYVFQAIDTDKIITTKIVENKNWKRDLLNGKGSLSRKARNKKKRKERNHKRIPTQYKVYIKSKWWTLRKNKFYRENKKICQACFNSKFVDLHHMVYGNYGNEKDEDLVALCRDCHSEFHERFGVKKNMKHDTNIFIIEKQESVSFPKF